jgi:hypothetical protein
LGGYGATQPAHEQEACEEGAKNPAMMSHRERSANTKRTSLRL